MRTNQNSLMAYRQHYQPHPINRASARHQRWRDVAFLSLVALGLAAFAAGFLLLALGGSEMYHPGTGIDPIFAGIGCVSLLINSAVLLFAAARIDTN